MTIEIISLPDYEAECVRMRLTEKVDHKLVLMVPRSHAMSAALSNVYPLWGKRGSGRE